jgi:hypothetical protein
MVVSWVYEDLDVHADQRPGLLLLVSTGGI